MNLAKLPAQTVRAGLISTAEKYVVSNSISIDDIEVDLVNCEGEACVLPSPNSQ